ncbi:MAG: hypothetical protein L0H84_09940 [Pseudonocardia sp.]|nr:hypothetical protein [Pseudonocardia sp.]
MTTTSTRLTLTSTVVAAGDAETVRDTIVHYLLRTGLRVGEVEPAEITAEGGSQLVVRMLGVWCAPEDAYPRRVRISYTPTVDGTQVDAAIEETLGFGYFDRRTRRNYLASFQRWLDGLGTALGPVSATR